MATATSDVVAITAPKLQGVWLHAVVDPDDTERHYLYQAGARGETLTVQTVSLQFVGRTFAVTEFGGEESQAMGLGIKVPWGPTHDADVQWIRDALRARRVLCYRDNRGRLLFGTLDGSVKVSDALDGSDIDVTINRVDYTEGA